VPDPGWEHSLSVQMGDAFCQYFTRELDLAYGYVDLLCLHLCFYLVHECRLLEGESGSILTLLNRKGLAPNARYLVMCVLDILAEEGILCIDGNEWRICRPCPHHESEELQRKAAADCPGASATFELIERCRQHAVAYINGCEPGLAAIFADGLELWERVYTTDAVMSVYTDLLAEPISMLVAQESLRILEIGAGVGSVIRKYCHLFRGRTSEYWITDLGRGFVQRARQLYGGEPFARFAVVDLDTSLAMQGLEEASFDAVIGVNVLHCARDLRFTLQALRSVLNGRGLLICAEGSPPERGKHWRLDLIFAFLRGWWDVRVDPLLRPRPGFLFPAEWRKALLSCGFNSAAILPGESWFSGPCRGGIIVASKA
jgi:SAM-dependent methyltransferase